MRPKSATAINNNSEFLIFGSAVLNVQHFLTRIIFKMPKYFCDYCDTYLTHDSPTVRKTHCGGRKHKENVKFYYQKWMEEQAQTLIDATTAAFKVSKLCTHLTLDRALRAFFG